MSGRQLRARVSTAANSQPPQGHTTPGRKKAMPSKEADSPAATANTNQPSQGILKSPLNVKQSTNGGYQTLQQQLQDVMAEKEELERTLKEQYRHIELIRETTCQLSLNVDLMQRVCQARIQAFDTDFLAERFIHHLPTEQEIRCASSEYTNGGSDSVSRSSSVHSTNRSPLQQHHSGLPSQKVFRSRDSRLSVLLEIKDIATVYNIFVAVLPILFISLCVQNYYESGEWIDFTLFFYSFRKLSIVVVAWFCMFGYACLGYGWKFAYSTTREKHDGKGSKKKGSSVRNTIHDSLVTVAYIAYQVVFALTAGFITLWFDLPPASGFIVMCEQTRMSMKVHSFFRENAQQQEPESGPSLDSVGFSHYLYFLFCPTLLYRTSYPRTPFVRWTRVISHFLECTFVILYIYILFKRYLFPAITVPPQPNQDEFQMFLLMTFNTMFPSMVLFVFGFFGVLHCWLNMWAELLQFADREFYRDWWNSNSFSEYYRKWNGVVYDWLFTYVYLECVSFLEHRKLSRHQSKLLGALFVIEVSAIIHEFILACALGHCFPALLLMYGGPGLFFTHLNRSQTKSRLQNIFVWAMLLLGCGLLVSLYSREYMIRHSYLQHTSNQFSWEYWGEFFTAYSLKHLFV